jgi:hypothetical protein
LMVNGRFLLTDHQNLKGGALWVALALFVEHYSCSFFGDVVFVSMLPVMSDCHWKL